MNDSQGHAAGDQLLREVAVGWQAELRGIDLLTRTGGDEFCLLLPNCAAGEERGVLRRLRAVMPAGQTFSVGVASWDRVEDAARLLERADRSLYADKRAALGVLDPERA